jgi:hypothetical protein
MLLTALPSVESLCNRKVSISSMKTTLGASFLASWNVAVISLLLSPNHLFIIVNSCTLTKVAFDSLAMAVAEINYFGRNRQERRNSASKARQWGENITSRNKQDETVIHFTFHLPFANMVLPVPGGLCWEEE